MNINTVLNKYIFRKTINSHPFYMKVILNILGQFYVQEAINL